LEVGWFLNWTGFKIVPKKLCYYGTFLYFYRHTDSKDTDAQAMEWEVTADDIECFFKGKYEFDYKHGHGVLEYSNKIRETGEWQKGYRQWKFIR
jgi:hypothetical protein